MATKKGTSFWATYIILLVLYIITLVMNESVALSVCPIIIGAFAFSGLGFQGVNVMDNWQKSKYYREELDHRGLNPINKSPPVKEI
jgi:hypothetical protein